MKQAAFLALSDTRDPDALPELIGALRARTGSELGERVASLASWPYDVRIAMAFAAMLLDPPFSSNGSRPFYGVLYAALLAHIDGQDAPDLGFYTPPVQPWGVTEQDQWLEQAHAHLREAVRTRREVIDARKTLPKRWSKHGTRIATLPAETAVGDALIAALGDADYGLTSAASPWLAAAILRHCDALHADLLDPRHVRFQPLIAALRRRPLAPEREAKRPTKREMTEPELLELVRADPTDDGPRLVYQDWLLERGDPRGEFLMVQYARLQRSLSEEELEREEALLRANLSRWLGGLDKIVPADFPVVFERGFPVELFLNPYTTTRKRHVREAVGLPDWATIERVHIAEPVSGLDEPAALRGLVELDGKVSPARAKQLVAKQPPSLRRLGIQAARHGQILDSKLWNHLVALPNLEELRLLSVGVVEGIVGKDFLLQLDLDVFPSLRLLGLEPSLYGTNATASELAEDVERVLPAGRRFALATNALSGRYRHLAWQNWDVQAPAATLITDRSGEHRVLEVDANALYDRRKLLSRFVGISAAEVRVVQWVRPPALPNFAAHPARQDGQVATKAARELKVPLDIVRVEHRHAFDAERGLMIVR